MAYIFGDSFDFYAAVTDAMAGYWDGGSITASNSQMTASNGRFANSQGIGTGNTAIAWLFKNSGSNDATHHIVCSFIQTVGLSGTGLGIYLQLGDGATAQCSIVFRGDGAIVLTSGGPGGSVLATYTNAFFANVWSSFEFEVTINNTTGAFHAR